MAVRIARCGADIRSASTIRCTTSVSILFHPSTLATYHGLSEKLAVRTETDKAQRGLVGLLVDKQQIGFQMALPMPRILARQNMISISLRKQFIACQAVAYRFKQGRWIAM